MGYFDGHYRLPMSQHELEVLITIFKDMIEDPPETDFAMMNSIDFDELQDLIEDLEAQLQDRADPDYILLRIYNTRTVRINFSIMIG